MLHLSTQSGRAPGPEALDVRRGWSRDLVSLVSSAPVASVGPLVPADELLVHQIADTFATVGQSDRSWTEKIWAMATDRAGTVQAVFGLGVYPNRGVVDAFGGISRGAEQWTVRASGRLGKNPDEGRVGPLRYEVVEPLKQVRFSLEANSVVPVSFEWLFQGIVPPMTERREEHRGATGRRSQPMSFATTRSAPPADG